MSISSRSSSARLDPTPGSPRKQWFIGLEVPPGQLTNPSTMPIGSNYNLFWHPDKNPAQPHFLLNGGSLAFSGWKQKSFDTPNSKYEDPKFPGIRGKRIM